MLRTRNHLAWLLASTVPALAAAQAPADTAQAATDLDQVVISGTLRPVRKLDSPVPVEVYTAQFFQKNPTPNLFEALALVNGVQPQINCNVCYTGDIHINGLEGPYTLVLIDGMPLVSALGSVYGLNGIPSELIQRVEIVKGPASTLYGSEAVGGLVNVITRDPATAPKLSLNTFRTSTGEYSLDAGWGLGRGKWRGMVSGSWFQLDRVWDRNADGFTDAALQRRVSGFTKWAYERPQGRALGFALRYLFEDRWGGQLDWTPAERGRDRIYGESIYTNRVEFIGTYQLPVPRQHLTLRWSYVFHDQNSVYGTTVYLGRQHVGFGQLVWDKPLGERHRLLAGSTLRYTRYDDNTPATRTADERNQPETVWMPGVFVEDEWALAPRHTLLLGARADHDPRHGSIFSPRLNWKWQTGGFSTLRLSLGNGYRVVNLFTEDHAALTGARQVVVRSALRPEQSWNANLNWTQFVSLGTRSFLNLDASVFHTYFTNRILPDYDTNPNQIIYDNLDGYSVSQGLTLNTDWSLAQRLRVNAGITWMDVFQRARDQNGQLQRQAQFHAPRFSGTWQVAYRFARLGLSLDYTGQLYGPMALPTVPNDFRPPRSPWFSLQNLQATQQLGKRLALYAGVKNLLDFLPANPLLRPNDPFDRTAADPVANPNGYTFDTAYNYAPLLGRRWFGGLRLVLP